MNVFCAFTLPPALILKILLHTDNKYLYFLFYVITGGFVLSIFSPLETGCHIAMANLECLILLPPSKCWSDRGVPP